MLNRVPFHLSKCTLSIPRVSAGEIGLCKRSPVLGGGTKYLRLCPRSIIFSSVLSGDGNGGSGRSGTSGRGVVEYLCGEGECIVSCSSAVPSVLIEEPEPGRDHGEC